MRRGISPRALELAFRIVAENQIREAERAGHLDGLPLQGQPLPCLDEPYDEDWWLRAWLRRYASSTSERCGDQRRR